MGSRDKDQTTTHHQPHISSMVVRPSVSDGGDGGGAGGSNDRGGGRTSGNDYEHGDTRREQPPFSRSDRYSDDPGHRTRAGSDSPLHRRDADHRFSSDFDQSRGAPRGREFNSGRDAGRFRDLSPRGRDAGRPLGRGFDGPAFGPRAPRGDGMGRNNPNVRPREGDWLCSDPACGNLNFARREYCNNCKRPRYGTGGSPRRYPGPPPPHAPPRRFPGPPLDISPGRTMNGYRSPPRGWVRDGPRDLGPGGPPPPRHGGRFPDHEMRRDRPDFLDDYYRGRSRFDRPLLPPMDWGHRDRGRDFFSNERKGFERRIPSPPPPPPPLHPQRGRWGRDFRERSRSPIRGGPPPRDYHRDMYMDRGRDDRRGMGRDRVGGVF